MTVHLSELKFYDQNLYVAELANAVLAVLSYVVWDTSATIHGMEISKLRKDKRSVDISQKIMEAV